MSGGCECAREQTLVNNTHTHTHNDQQLDSDFITNSRHLFIVVLPLVGTRHGRLDGSTFLKKLNVVFRRISLHPLRIIGLFRVNMILTHGPSTGIAVKGMVCG